MHKFLVKALAAVAVAILPGTAHAFDVRVTVFETIGGINQEVAAWTQDQNAPPDAFAMGFYTTVPVFNAFGLSGDDSVTWYSAANDQLGGFTNYSEDFNVLAQTSYASLESAPVFLPGSYHGIDVKPDLSYIPVSYTIAVIPATKFRSNFSFHADTAEPTTTLPEPTSWAMMFAGLGMIGYIVRRRRNGSIANA